MINRVLNVVLIIFLGMCLEISLRGAFPGFPHFDGVAAGWAGYAVAWAIWAPMKETSK